MTAPTPVTLAPPGSDLSESALQSAMVRYYRNTFCLKHHDPRCMIYHISNEENITGYNVGLLPGNSDLNIFHHPTSRKTDYHRRLIEQGLLLPIVVKFEVKALGKKQGPAQIKFQSYCRNVGIPYFVGDCMEDFMKVVDWLEGYDGRLPKENVV